jgi:hypothetical protein
VVLKITDVSPFGFVSVSSNNLAKEERINGLRCG